MTKNCHSLFIGMAKNGKREQQQEKLEHPAKEPARFRHVSQRRIRDLKNARCGAFLPSDLFE